MPYDFEIMYFLSGIAIFQSLFIAFYLFIQKRGIRIRRHLLALVLIAFAVFILGTLILIQSHDNFWGHILNLSIFLTAPLLYFYFKSYLSNGSLISWKELYHFLPFVFVFSFMLYKVILLNEGYFAFQPYGLFLVSLLILQNIIYYWFILAKLKNDSDLDKLKWFRIILKVFIVVLFFNLITFVLWKVFGLLYICFLVTNIFFVFSFIFANTLILMALHKPESITGTVKYQYSQINKDLKNGYLDKLEEIMGTDEIYLDPLISLDKVAKQLHISDKHLSQLLNEIYVMNFNQYINKYRIEKAMALMAHESNRQKNILEIAYAVGFNSKTTFNTAFKKFTGNTPSEFRTLN